jgi:hypothetical protein
MTEKKIQSTVKSLEWIYGVVIALAISEAFIGFASSVDSKVPGLQWDRIFSLCSFLLLVVPFYHGMCRYLCEMYETTPVKPDYGRWLLIDCLAFTVEAGLFFVLAHSLPKHLWVQFSLGLIVLLFWDVLWGAFVWKCRTNIISSWVIVNLCTMPALAVVILCLRTNTSWWGVSLVFFAVLIRAVADYGTMWSFYFPRISTEDPPPSAET